MLCENCKENEATIHYTEIINGVKTEHHLCSECASKLDLTEYASVLDSDFPFVKLLTGLLASNGMLGEEVDTPMMHVRCPQCGMNFQEFTQVGKFGCAECYDVFGPLIEDNMKKIHGSVEHTGKVYKKSLKKTARKIGKSGKTLKSGKAEGSNDIDNIDHADGLQPGQTTEENMNVLEQIAKLNSRLRAAVKAEEFEEAAKLRDEIKAIRERNETDA